MSADNQIERIEGYIVGCIDAPVFFVGLLIMSAAPIAQPRIRILVADDHSVIRRMVRTTLEEHAHFEVCTEAENGAEAVETGEKGQAGRNHSKHHAARIERIRCGPRNQAATTAICNRDFIDSLASGHTPQNRMWPRHLLKL